MRKNATTLIAPLAAAAVVGLVGTAPAQATGGGEHGEHGHHGGYGGDRQVVVEIETSDEATAVLDEAGVDLDAVDPATASHQEDGATELSFPEAEDDKHEKSGWSEEIAFDGGVTYASDAASTTWLEPTVDTEEWTVSFDVDGERVDLLQAVPTEGEESTESLERTDGTDNPDGADLALTEAGAAALNEVAGEGAFAEGDVLADVEGGHHA